MELFSVHGILYGIIYLLLFLGKVFSCAFFSELFLLVLHIAMHFWFGCRRCKQSKPLQLKNGYISMIIIACISIFFPNSRGKQFSDEFLITHKLKEVQLLILSVQSYSKYPIIFKLAQILLHMV